jgi:WD40 repeat protein
MAPYQMSQVKELMMRTTGARFLALIVSILAPTVVATQPSGGRVSVAAATGSMAKAHAKELTASALSTDGRLLASGSTDKTIKLWSIPRPLRSSELCHR